VERRLVAGFRSGAIAQLIGHGKSLPIIYPRDQVVFVSVIVWRSRCSEVNDADRLDNTVRLALLASQPLGRKPAPLMDRPAHTARAAAALSATFASGPVRIRYDPGNGSLGKDRDAGMLPAPIVSLPIPVTRTPWMLAAHTATVCKFLMAIGASGKESWTSVKSPEHWEPNSGELGTDIHNFAYTNIPSKSMNLVLHSPL